MAETEKQKKARLLNAAKRKQRQQEYARMQAKVKGVESKGGALTEMKRTTPGDVSATGRTGPEAAPNLAIRGKGLGSKRKTPPTLRVPSKGRRKHPKGAIAVNDKGDYQYGDVYRDYMKDDGYRKI
jgi:hypothetical protein